LIAQGPGMVWCRWCGRQALKMTVSPACMAKCGKMRLCLPIVRNTQHCTLAGRTEWTKQVMDNATRCSSVRHTHRHIWSICMIHHSSAHLLIAFDHLQDVIAVLPWLYICTLLHFLQVQHGWSCAVLYRPLNLCRRNNHAVWSQLTRFGVTDQTRDNDQHPPPHTYYLSNATDLSCICDHYWQQSMQAWFNRALLTND